MANNQTKCGIIYEKNATRAVDDARMINYERPYEKNCILHFLISLFVFFVIPFPFCLTKIKLIKLTCYMALFYAIAVNMPFLEFLTKKCFSFNHTIDAG